MKKFLTLFSALILLGSMMTVSAHTFTSGTTIYIDFRNVSGGADFPSASSASTQYKGDAGGTIQAVTFTTNVTWNNGSTFIKTNTGGWANIGFTAPSSGQNCAVVSANGKSFTWTTVTNSNYTVYFKNNPAWTNVYVHLYNDATTFGSNGVGGQAAAVNATMTKIDAGPFWKYEYSSIVKYTKVCFTKEAQNDYQNFWQNECSWSDGLDFDHDKVLWIPNTASSSSINSCTYYNTGAWSEYPPVSPIVSFSGLPATVGVGQQVTFAATSENVSNPTYTFYVKKGSGSYGSAVTSYTFASADTYTIKVEVRSNGTGSALDTKEATITCNPSYTVYFKNTPGWTNVYAHLYPSGQTFGDKGVGGQSAEINAAMTKIDDGPYWKLEYNSATKYTKVCFTRDFQDGYENFWETQCSWSTGLDFDNNLVLWIPSTASSDSKNSCTYYNTGSWSVYPPLVPSVAFSGVPTNVYYGQQVTFAATSENVSNPTYTYQIKVGEGEYTAAANPYTFNAAGSYMVKVEVRENGAGEALDHAEQAITCLKYSLMQNNHTASDKGSEVAVCSSTDGTTFTATWDCPSAGTYYFYVTTNTAADAHTACDYLNGSQTFTDGTPVGVYRYNDATNCYNASITLNAPRAGEYTFTLTLNGSEPHSFKCDFPAALDAEVNLDALPEIAYLNNSFTLADYVGSVNVVQPEYTFYVKKGDAAYGSAVTSYTFAETGTYTVKAEVREQNAGGAALDDVEKVVTIYEPLTLYYVNKNDAWAVVKAYAYGAGEVKNATWPGETMTATGEESNHGHDVYSITIPVGRYNKIIFNNGNSGDGNQTGDLSFNAATPYYFDGTWYATLDACDPLTAEFSGVADYYLVGANVTLAATSNLTNPSYTYQVKVGEGDFAAATNPYTVAAAGTYTFKVTATGDEGNASATKVVTVHEPLTLYYVNKNDAWAVVKAYAYGAGEVKNATWPGETMTATGEESNHGHDVYSITIPVGRYNKIIFNNGNSGDGNQTGDLSFNAATPYYFDGAWYATLDACDPLILTTNIYLVGSIVGWDPLETYHFMKATEDATVASTTVTINEYSNITFKLKDNGNWRGCNPQKTITKDDRSVTILSDAEGENVLMTPYAAGDYIFTLNLSTRQLTVTYPSGDPMPIPQNIFLAGEMNSWAPANNDYKFAVSGDVATLEVTTLEAMHDYEFKLVYNGTWLRADYDFKYYWCSDVAFSAGDGDGAKIYTFKAGTYTFTYNLTSGQLSIAYPATSATDVEISQYEYATLYSATAFDVPDNVEAYVISGIDGIRLASERIYHIPANTGVLLHAPQGTYQFYEGDGRYMDAVGTNLFKGSTANQEINNELVHYVLSYDNDFQVGFYWPYGTGAAQGVGPFTNNAGKAYLEIPANSQPSGVIARRGFPLVIGAGVPTGIEDLNTNAEQTKFIYNGQLLIQHNGLLFNAQGARVR